MTTYKEFLQQHERLTGNVVEALKSRDAARDRCAHADAQYDAALAEDRPSIEPEVKSAYSALSGSEKRLDDANQELVQYEWDHRELDDARRAGIAPAPTPGERLESAIDTARNVSAVIGIATQLHVAVPPDPSPTVQVKAVTQEQLSEGPEKENVDDLLEPLAKEPDEIREDGEKARRDVDDANRTYDDAIENAPSRDAPPAPTPALPDPDPPAAAIATAPAPANDDHPRAANDNDPRGR